MADAKQVQLKYALFGGDEAARARIAAIAHPCEPHFGHGKVDFGVLLLALDAPSPVEVKARIAELAGAPLFVIGPARTDFAVRALKLGAADYLDEPLDAPTLRARVAELRPTVRQAARTDLLVGESPAMAKVRAQIELFGAGTEPVLILGESGTGKELVARAVHLASPRQAKPFHAINCSTIVDTLAESELFGARRGAYTGAAADRPGLFAAANGSTLFLDEVGTASPALQAKLLRVLESGEFMSLGSATATRVDVRIVAATNANMKDARADKQFRDDLYFRLAGAVIHLPPLRDRLEDLPLLVAHHLTGLATRLRRPMPRVDADAFERMRAHGWPGNIRELVHVLSNAFTVCTNNTIYASDLPLPTGTEASPLESYEDARHAFERAYVEKLLRLTKGNVSEASRIAGRTRKDMYKLFERAGLDPTTYR